MESLSVIAQLDNLTDIMDFVREFSLSHAANPGQLMAIEMAVEEVAVNVMHYAYPEDNPGNIEISCQMSKENSLLIEISDHGKPYDPLSREEPDINAGIDERGIGGLGIYLTKQMMDDVSYKNENGKNILQLSKSLNNP